MSAWEHSQPVYAPICPNTRRAVASAVWLHPPHSHESECHIAQCLLQSKRYGEKLNNFTAFNARWHMPSSTSAGVMNMWHIPRGTRLLNLATHPTVIPYSGLDLFPVQVLLERRSGPLRLTQYRDRFSHCGGAFARRCFELSSRKLWAAGRVPSPADTYCPCLSLCVWLGACVPACLSVSLSLCLCLLHIHIAEQVYGLARGGPPCSGG